MKISKRIKVAVHCKRLIAEFNMGYYGYGDSASQRVLIGAHVKFSD